MREMKLEHAVCFGKHRYYPKCDLSTTILRLLNANCLTDWQIEILGEVFDLDIEESHQTALYKNGRKAGYGQKVADKVD